MKQSTSQNILHKLNLPSIRSWSAVNLCCGLVICASPVQVLMYRIFRGPTGPSLTESMMEIKTDEQYNQGAINKS